MLKEILKHNLQGKTFNVTFFKKDGSIRELTGRLGVTKHLKGVGKRYDYSNLLTVAELLRDEKGRFKGTQYRTVNLENIISLKCGDINYRR